jgi:hypothetical protein
VIFKIEVVPEKNANQILLLTMAKDVTGKLNGGQRDLFRG